MTTLKLDLGNLKKDVVSTFTRGDSNVLVSLSSYDVPQSLTFRPQHQGLIQVRFDYPDQEQDDAKKLNECVTLILGKNSGKVLGFDLHTTPSYRAHDLALQVMRGVEEEEKRPGLRDNQRLNYRLIGRVVGENLEPLLAAG